MCNFTHMSKFCACEWGLSDKCIFGNNPVKYANQSLMRITMCVFPIVNVYYLIGPYFLVYCKFINTFFTLIHIINAI